MPSTNDEKEIFHPCHWLAKPNTTSLGGHILELDTAKVGIASSRQ